MGANTIKMITLKSSNGGEFIVPQAVAMHSQTIRHLIEEDNTRNSILLANANSMILAMVIEYYKKHVISHAEAPDMMSSEDELKNWDAEFVNIDNDTLRKLISAADYLQINGLLDLACQKMADMMEEKSIEELREMFDIENDFTPEEEEELRREIGWTFD